MSAVITVSGAFELSIVLCVGVQARRLIGVSRKEKMRVARAACRSCLPLVLDRS